MLKKSLKICLKVFLTLLFIPYVLLTSLAFILTAFFPEQLIYKMSVLFAYIGWYLCILNLRLTCNINLTSDKLSDSYVLISNHIGSLDFILLHEIAVRNSMLWYMKYIIKKEVLWIPLFGYIMKKIKFVFVKRNFEEDKNVLANHCTELKETNKKVWFVVYPEGTRYTKKKCDQSNQFAISVNKPTFRNVLFPKGRGLKVIVDNLKGSHIKEVIDVTLFYYGNVPSLLYFLFFETDANVRIDIRKVKIDEISDVNEFLIECFKRKDRMIEEWKNEAPKNK